MPCLLAETTSASEWTGNAFVGTVSFVMTFLATVEALAARAGGRGTLACQVTGLITPNLRHQIAAVLMRLKENHSQTTGSPITTFISTWTRSITSESVIVPAIIPGFRSTIPFIIVFPGSLPFSEVS